MKDKVIEEEIICSKCKSEILLDSERCWRCGKLQKLGRKKMFWTFARKLITLAIIYAIMFVIYLRFKDEITKVFEVVIKIVLALIGLFFFGLFA